MDFVLAWSTGGNDRKKAFTVAKGLEVQGKELRAKADGQALVVDSVSGITIIAGGLEDRFLQQITTANKVAGSAVELASNGGLENTSGGGLALDYNSDMFSIDVTSGLQLDYLASELQFVPGSGLQINAVPLAKLPSTLVLTDGSRAFTAPQAGVDAVNPNHLTTLSQVQSLVGGDFSTTMLNLAGRTVQKGEVGYIESVTGSFKLAKADSPSTAIVQYVVDATTIADGASGAFLNPSTNIELAGELVSGFAPGDTLFLSVTEQGRFQSTAPSVTGQTILDCGWRKVPSDCFVFFPQEPIDL